MSHAGGQVDLLCARTKAVARSHYSQQRTHKFSNHLFLYHGKCQPYCIAFVWHHFFGTAQQQV
jgi:hypothetical protein